MTITVRKNKDNKNVYDVAFMYKGVRYKKRGFATKTQARDWETDVKSQVLQSGHYYTPCKKTFLEVFYEAFEIEKVKKDMKPSTVQSYKISINRIKKNRIANMKIVDIDYATVQSYFNEISKKYSASTCNSTKKCFSLAFKHAMRNGYIKTDPMAYTECHGLKYEHDNETITYNEFMNLIDHFQDDKPIQIALYIGYYSGLRIGEVLALEKSDIDFKKHTISISKNMDTRLNEIITPKTKSSNAVIPMAPVLEQILIEWVNESPYDVLISYNGDYASYKRMSRLFHDVGFHFHMLRHTFTSNLIASGADVKTTQSLLRHANVQTTLDVYAHSDFEKQQETINKVFQTTPKLPQKVIN